MQLRTRKKLARHRKAKIKKAHRLLWGRRFVWVQIKALGGLNPSRRFQWKNWVGKYTAISMDEFVRRASERSKMLAMNDPEQEPKVKP